MRSKQPTIALYASVALATAALATMTAGTIVLTTDAPGGAYIVKLNGTTKTLAPIDASTVLGPWATRAMSLTATPGAAASGNVAYSCEVLNADTDPVPGALVFVGCVRSAGAGSGSLSVSAGVIVQYLNVGGNSLAAVISCTAGGIAAWTLNGTAGNTWTCNAATDAATGGQVESDAGRVLP